MAANELNIKKTKIWKWLLIALGFIAIILFSAYRSHNLFKETVLNNFHDQQMNLARSLNAMILEYLNDVGMNLQAIAEEVKHNGTLDESPKSITSIYETHKDDFLSIHIADDEGRMLYSIPEEMKRDSRSVFFINKTIGEHKNTEEPFLSEGYFTSDMSIIDIYIPFKLKGEKRYFIAGRFKIEEYLAEHFSSWGTKDIDLLLSNDNGDILSLLNINHEYHEPLSKGNIRSLGEKCLSCHKRDDFNDIIQSGDNRNIVHSVYTYPSGKIENRTSISFPIHDQIWTVTVGSPYKPVQGVIDKDFRKKLLYSALSLIVLGFLGYNLHRTQRKSAILIAETENLRKLADSVEALRESEERYSTLFNDSLDAVYISTTDGTFLDVNQSMLDLFGYSQDELINQNAKDQYNNAEARKSFQELIEKMGSVHNLEVQYRKKNGELMECLETATLKRDMDGNIIGYQGIIRDITKRKQAEEALRLARFSADQAFDSIFWIGPDSMFADVNDTACKNLGYTRDELLSMSVSDIDPAFPADKWVETWKVITTQRHMRLEGCHLRKDGSEFPVEITADVVKFDDRELVCAIASDITERKQAEEELRLMKFYIDNAGDGVFLVEPDAKFAYVNNAACSSLGYSREELLSMTVHDVDPNFPREIWKEHWKNIKHRGSFNFESINRTKEGRTFPVEIGVKYLDYQGKEYNCAFVRDISERKRAEEELSTLSRAVEQSPSSVVITDTDGCIEYVNPKFTQITGYSADEAMAQNLRILKSGEQPKEFYKELWDTISSGREWRGEFHNRKKNGELFWESASISPVLDDKGDITHYIAVKEDITEKKKAEEERIELHQQLEKSRRMESLGVLAGGVAHDLNNILGPMLGYPDLMLREISDESPLRSDLLRIKEAGSSASDIVADLLTLARRGRYEMKPLNLNEVIRSYIHTPQFDDQKNRFRNIVVEEDLAENLFNISGSDKHLPKVVMNLLGNAFESMETTGGKLKINTYNTYLEEKVLADELIEKGEYVVMKLNDQGIGIDEEHLGKIFEPFYSRKEMGRSGTGLGLAIVYGIVKDHGGYVEIESKIGFGTEFTLYFPAIREDIKEESDNFSTYRGNETILIVDDEETQRELTARMLSSLGYKVELISNGHEAIEFLRKKKVDLVVLDMIMETDFDGLDTYAEIIKMQPDQKAIIVSGFSETDRVKKALKLGAGRYIKKPYTMDIISKAVREELDK